jgi:hypothetical protein
VLRVKINAKEINKTLENAVSYSYGFLDGVEVDQILFNKRLGEYTIDALGLYIDAQARSNQEAFHHVYEWGSTGNKNSRLFEFTSSASKRIITISGIFLQSSVPSPTSDEIFYDKASVMENGIEIVVEPKFSDVLAFEVDGEMVFTTNSVFIANPGGPEVEGSFGRAVDNFFDSYFTKSLLKPFMKKLDNPVEFAQSFAAGARVGRSAGISAGKRYMKSAGSIIE